MKTSMIVALLGLAAASYSTAAMAEETAKPAPAGRVVLLDRVDITAHRVWPLSVADVARVSPKVPLAQLKQPLVDRIAGAVEKDPF